MRYRLPGTSSVVSSRQPRLPSALDFSQPGKEFAERVGARQGLRIVSSGSRRVFREPMSLHPPWLRTPVVDRPWLRRPIIGLRIETPLQRLQAHVCDGADRNVLYTANHNARSSEELRCALRRINQLLREIAANTPGASGCRIHLPQAPRRWRAERRLMGRFPNDRVRAADSRAVTATSRRASSPGRRDSTTNASHASWTDTSICSRSAPTSRAWPIRATCGTRSAATSRSLSTPQPVGRSVGEAPSVSDAGM